MALDRSGLRHRENFDGPSTFYRTPPPTDPISDQYGTGHMDARHLQAGEEPVAEGIDYPNA